MRFAYVIVLFLSPVIGMLINVSISYINDNEALLIMIMLIIISVIILNALIYFLNFKFTVLSTLLGLTYLIVALLGFYIIGIQIYTSTLYFNDIFSFTIISITINAVITYVIIRSALMYFNFKFTSLSSFLGLIFFILGLILFVSSSHSWNHEIDKIEYNRIQHLYDKVKENPKLEKLFKTKLDEAKKDNIILRKEYYTLERIYKYSFHLIDKESVQKY